MENLSDIKIKIKSLIFFVASQPIEEEKQAVLQDKLESDEYLNKYINDRLTPSILKYVTNDIVAGSLYAYHYYNTKKIMNNNNV